MSKLIDRLTTVLFEKGVSEDRAACSQIAKDFLELVRAELPQCSECGVKFITAKPGHQ
jgi:hypothetical protein